jgi:hypothetical protein
MDVRELGWGGVDWIYLPQNKDRWRGPCERGDERPSSIKCWEFLE